VLATACGVGAKPYPEVSLKILAIYEGTSINTARLIAASTDPRLVATLAREIVGEPDTVEVPDEREPLRLVSDGDDG
jgi:hypothetical protein